MNMSHIMRSAINLTQITDKSQNIIKNKKKTK